jgi:hypothetical protein
MSNPPKRNSNCHWGLARHRRGLRAFGCGGRLSRRRQLQAQS